MNSLQEIKTYGEREGSTLGFGREVRVEDFIVGGRYEVETGLSYLLEGVKIITDSVKGPMKSREVRPRPPWTHFWHY